MGWEYTVTAGAREKTTHTGKPKVEGREEMVVSLNPKEKNTEKTEYRGILCCGWGGQLWSSNLSLAIGCSAQSRYFFFLLLWEILPGKLQRKGLGKEGFLVRAVVGRVFNRTQQEKRCGKKFEMLYFLLGGEFSE